MAHMKRAVLVLLLVGCGGIESQPSELSQMDVAGVWEEIYWMTDPPHLAPTDAREHRQGTEVAFLSAETAEEIAHAFTHVWARRMVIEQGGRDTGGDPDHQGTLWIGGAPPAHNGGPLEQRALDWLRAYPTR